MKRASLIAAAAVVFCAGLTAMGAKTPPPPKKDAPPAKKAVLPPAYAWMTTELELLEAQQNKIVEKLSPANYNKNVAELKKSDADRFKELQKDLADAQKAKEAATVKEVQGKIATLRALSTRVNARAKDKMEEDAMAEMTPEQKTKWASRQAMADLLPQLRQKGITLDQEQKTKMRELCAGKSEQLLVNWGTGDPDKVKARLEVLKGIIDESKTGVLKEDQVKKLPKDKPADSAPKGGAAG